MSTRKFFLIYVLIAVLVVVAVLADRAWGGVV